VQGRLLKARPSFQARRVPIGRIVLLLLVVAGVAAFAILRLRPKAVTTMPVVPGTVVDAVYATCTVEAFDRLTIKAKVAGSIDLKVREGDPVKKGDLLAAIDSPALRYELERAEVDQRAASKQAGKASPQLAALEAQVKATEAELRHARAERDRAKRLAGTGATSEVDLEAAESRVARLEAELAAQEARRMSSKVDLTARASGSSAVVSELTARIADTEVRSPLDGVVLSKMVELGEAVIASQPLLRIGDVSNLVLECAVDESDVGRIGVDTRAAASLYAFDKQVFRGVVFDVLPDADRTKRSFLVKVRLSDPPRGLRSGMSAEVNLIVKEHPGVLLAPSEAIDASSSVWVVEGGRLAKRPVKMGVRDLLFVEVLDGLREGEEVVISGDAEALREGARVSAIRKEPDAARAPKGSAP
jgi:multidrug efflux pump subunit AcrA (membrane-fusion protein)